MKQSLTKFSNQILKKLIKISASQVAGVMENALSDEDIQISNELIIVKVKIAEDIINIKSVAIELQKKIYFDLSNQMDEEELAINIIVKNN